jgi:phosphatidylinositol-3-phosphatase
VKSPRAAFAALDARLAHLRIPSPRVSALLVLGFLAFGVVIGAATGSRADETLAASSRPPLKLVLPATSAAKATSTAASPSASEPPPAESEPTPAAAAPEASSPTPAAPATKAPAKGSAGKSGEAGGGGSGGGEGGSTSPAGGGAKLPAVKHVFVIMLSDEPYAAAFGPESAAPYLARTLERQGELFVRYYAVAHEQLANGIALLSGQGPTRATAMNCPTYAAVTPASSAAEGQFLGEGCVYPQTTPTLLGQLEVKRLSWRAYVQGIDEPGAAAPACARPAVGAPDPSAAPSSSAQYATFRNPFVYFQGLTESRSCASDDVGLGSLSADLAKPASTPNLSYIVPDRCHDGSPGPCPGGAPGGLQAADAFLEGVVPKIVSSKAFKEHGLLVITTDAAPSSGAFADSSSCCGQPRFPNLPPPTGIAASLPPEGGGQVGALLLSPFVKPHTVSQEPFNDFSLLRTIEDLFGLKHLGYAGGAKVTAFEPALFTEKPARKG